MLFAAVAHWGLGIASGKHMLLYDGIKDRISLPEEKSYILNYIFWIATELNHGLEVAYYALLTLVISYWVKESHFLSTLPLLLRYIIAYFLPYYDSNWNLLWFRWIHPVPIYRYYGWGLFTEDAFIFLLDGLTNSRLGEVILVIWSLAWGIVNSFISLTDVSGKWNYLVPAKWLALETYVGNPNVLKNTLLIIGCINVILYIANQWIVKKKLITIS